jgi:hypothetical protein
MKLFEEIARSLRLVKGVHQPEVLEPETPTSASEFEIIVPSDAAARHAGFSPELRDTIRVIRHDVLATLRQVPAFVSAAQKMASEGCLYRVLVSEEHVHLLREGADGIVNPFLRDAQGRFVKNVDLIRFRRGDRRYRYQRCAGGNLGQTRRSCDDGRKSG